MSDKTWSEDSKYRHKDQAVPDDVRPQRGKKNTRKWCRGKEGREHVPVMVYDPPAWTKNVHCHTSTWLKGYWVCYHRIECEVCGKHLYVWLIRECPDYPKDSDEK